MSNEMFKRMVDVAKEETSVTFDADSITTQELAQELGWGETRARQYASRKLQAGEWEVVHKHGYQGRPVKAFRIKKS